MAGTRLQQASMKSPAYAAGHLRLLQVAVAVSLLAVSGLAAVLAWMPGSSAAALLPRDKLAPPSARPAGEAAQTSLLPTGAGRQLKVKCPECGVIAALREIEQAGAPAGMTRSNRTGNQEKASRRYEVTVRMKDGSSRVFMDAVSAKWRPGERVILIEGANQAND